MAVITIRSELGRLASNSLLNPTESATMAGLWSHSNSQSRDVRCHSSRDVQEKRSNTQTVASRPAGTTVPCGRRVVTSGASIRQSIR